MTNPFNYCTRCGNELTRQEAKMATEEEGAPLCVECYMAIFKEMANTFVGAANEAAQHVREAFQPLVDATRPQEARDE